MRLPIGPLDRCDATAIVRLIGSAVSDGEGSAAGFEAVGPDGIDVPDAATLARGDAIGCGEVGNARSATTLTTAAAARTTQIRAGCREALPSTIIGASFRFARPC